MGLEICRLFRRAYINLGLCFIKILNKEKSRIRSCIQWTCGEIGPWTPGKYIEGMTSTKKARAISCTSLKELDGGGSPLRVYIVEARKTRQSEVKRADLLWQVAQGRRCPNRPPRSPPTGHSLSIRYHTVVFRSVHLFLFLFLSWTRCPRSHSVLLLRWPSASFPFTLFYSVRDSV